MKKLLIQALSFFGISGIGWLMDMGIYTVVSSVFDISVGIINMFSSLVAVTFVYIVSTKKLFKNNENKFNIRKKYVFYILYQVCMICFSSMMIGLIASNLMKSSIVFIKSFYKVLSKVIFTPVTMIINFFFMKWLLEKV